MCPLSFCTGFLSWKYNSPPHGAKSPHVVDCVLFCSVIPKSLAPPLLWNCVLNKNSRQHKTGDFLNQGINLYWHFCAGANERLMNGVLTVKPVYLWPVTLTSSLLAYVIILDISTPPPLVILSFAFIPAGSGGPKRGQTLAHLYYTTNNLTCNTKYAIYLLL